MGFYQGDSGGPLVYLDGSQHYVVAAVVSTGYGCGDEDFPGLYVDLRRPQQLRWLKQTAFL